MISQRAASLVSSPSAIVMGHLKCLEDPFSSSNSEGYLNFGIAQNHLMDDMLIPKLEQSVKFEPEHIQYCDLSGIEKTRNIMASFLENYIGLKNIELEKLVINAGVSCLCESLSFCMFDSGDKILIPAPYYTGFKHDFQKRFGCEFQNVYLTGDLKHDIEPFRKAYTPDCKAILLTHPHNPTGEILSEKFMQDIVDFAIEKDLEIISDEIYALSIHRGTHKSLYQFAKEKGAKAHFLYGLAKDFALAGFKVGMFYSDDEELLSAMKATSYFYPVSSSTQLIMDNIFFDSNFLDQFINTNQKRLKDCKDKILTNLNDFKFIYDDAAMFMLVDLSEFCRSFDEEKALFERLINEFKINLTPGGEQGMNIPGYFRVCYARDNDTIDEFIRRMRKVKSVL